jgi:hypothetical protein
MPSRTNLSTSRRLLIIIGADIFNVFLAWNSLSGFTNVLLFISFVHLSMSTLNPCYKTRYKTTSLLRKLPNNVRRLDPDLQNPAVRTSISARGLL